MTRLISVTTDEGTNPQGYLAIVSTVNGRCHCPQMEHTDEMRFN